MHQAPLSRIAYPGVPDQGVLMVLLAPEDIPAAALQGDLAVLDAEERARHARFVAARHRHQFAVARVALRCLLGQTIGVSPEQVVLVRDAFGKPQLADAAGVQFNVSHCDGMVALAVARDCRVGVDVEDAARRQAEFELVADQYFAPPERDWVRAVGGQERLARFIELWTLKEAYIKAIGRGLAKNLAECVFDCSDTRGALAFRDALPGPEAQASWDFSQWSCAGRLRVALALEARQTDRDDALHAPGTVDAFVVRGGAVVPETTITRLRRGRGIQESAHDIALQEAVEARSPDAGTCQSNGA